MAKAKSQRTVTIVLVVEMEPEHIPGDVVEFEELTGDMLEHNSQSLIRAAIYDGSRSITTAPAPFARIG